jgi:hypothetical protein
MRHFFFSLVVVASLVGCPAPDGDDGGEGEGREG